MADEEELDKNQQAGVENIVQQVATGTDDTEASEHPTDVYQDRQRIVSPDAAEPITSSDDVAEASGSSEERPPLTQGESEKR